LIGSPLLDPPATWSQRHELQQLPVATARRSAHLSQAPSAKTRAADVALATIARRDDRQVGFRLPSMRLGQEAPNLVAHLHRT
jgi:hypothetical protein